MKRLKLTAGLTVGLMFVASAALADGASVDGDFATTGLQNTLAFGDVCADSGATTQTAKWYVVRQGNADQNNYANSSTVSFALRPPNAVAITDPAATDGTIGFAFPGSHQVALPSTWISSDNGTLSGPVDGSITITPGSTTGAHSGTVKMQASGVNQSAGTAISDNADLTVTWTVLAADDPECTTASYTIDGFYQPVENAVVNGAKAGRVIPLKFNILDEENIKQSDVELVDVFTMKAPCSGGEPEPLADDETLSSGKTELRWDEAGQQMIFNWKTPRTKGCYTIRLVVEGGAEHSVDFQLS